MGLSWLVANAQLQLFDEKVLVGTLRFLYVVVSRKSGQFWLFRQVMTTDLVLHPLA